MDEAQLKEFLTITILLKEWVTLRCSISGYPEGKIKLHIIVLFTTDKKKDLT